MNSTGPFRSAAPSMRSRQVAASIVGVEVWLRTKKRSLGIAYPRSPTASQRISALVP